MVVSGPVPSAVSSLITRHGAKTEGSSLPVELHHITDGKIHDLSSSASTETVTLISGLPPKHSYIHPDFQNHLLRQAIPESDVEVQREWVVPVSLGEKWSLKQFAAVFDALPAREVMVRVNGGDPGREWKDAKRVLMGMVSTSGKGGDGTVVYYIMQEGEVKPRQNG